ncbi:L-asparaginase II [Helicobacter sp. NHP19-003]|uniref:L-asparaginase II n=1 Tax=Helicobacter gastrocanis TaxID=2849641 RepID=A0ABN6I6I2_9HELI|nr:asparaginase [Helicobacter sp. NHP19-003]BCZ17728.1 L-asparaginase II [Helicobacter sp. NHP19-003]
MDKVMVLATGGTIAGIGQGGAYVSGQVGVNDLLKGVVPKGVELESVQVANVGSQDMDSDIWRKLLECIHTLSAREDIKGFVITHGTDTMEESAYFLHLNAQTHKPIVLTGAMRNSTSLSPDGPMNLHNALAVCVHPKSAGLGVLVAMDENIYSARHVSKTHTSHLGAFKASNAGPIGHVYYGQVSFHAKPTTKHTLQSQLALGDSTQPLPKVAVVYTYVDCGDFLLKATLQAGVQGVVVAGMGNGNVSHTLLEAMAEAVKQGVVVVRSSRVGGGEVQLGEMDDARYHFVRAGDLNPQKARVLLQLALLKSTTPQAIQEFFNTH